MSRIVSTMPRYTPEELERRRALARSFEASAIQEGYTPTEEDRELTRQLAEGEISEEQHRTLILARYRAILA